MKKSKYSLITLYIYILKWFSMFYFLSDEYYRLILTFFILFWTVGLPLYYAQLYGYKLSSYLKSNQYKLYYEFSRNSISNNDKEVFLIDSKSISKNKNKFELLSNKNKKIIYKIIDLNRTIKISITLFIFENILFIYLLLGSS